jgi:hypothetical protein
MTSLKEQLWEYNGYMNMGCAEVTAEKIIKELEQLRVKHELDVWKTDWKEGYDYAMNLIFKSLQGECKAEVWISSDSEKVTGLGKKQ